MRPRRAKRSEKRRWTAYSFLSLGVVVGSLLLQGCGGAGTSSVEEQWAMLDKYCASCHNDIDLTADISFDSLSPHAIAAEAEAWEKVVRKLRGRMMPPPGEPRPSNREIDAFVAALESNLDDAASQYEPRTVAIRRLNRTEYARAIKDLLALDVDAEGLLPADGVQGGFDTVASALQVSPTFIDQYLTSARNLAAQAVGNASPRAVGANYAVSGNQQFHVRGLPLGTRGGGLVEHYFPADGDYVLNIGDLVTGMWGLNQEHVNTLIATLDGKKFFELDIGGDEDLRAIDQLQAPAVDRINAQLKNIPFRATAGVHKVAVTFLHRSFAESDAQLHLLTPGGGQDAVLRVRGFEIVGPFDPSGLSATPSRRKIFDCYPQAPAENTACAFRIVSRIAAEAFRGSANDEDIETLMHFYEAGSSQGSFEDGVKYALSAILAHPKFLYREESSPASLTPGSRYQLSSYELASRLSLFLWSTLPDEELLQAAASDGLKDQATLERQVKRMLADPRSESLASSFAYQWLRLGELKSIDPDPAIFADVDPLIRRELIEETQRFVDGVFREDRSVLDLLTSNVTYLNERLALHYGINTVRGDYFRRVELPDERRWGLLGKGSVLMVSSYPNRTAPVLRGQWVLENIIGSPPPHPPPDVEALPEIVEGQAATTVRARLEAHRANPSCNGCHGVMDPLGFALENFDAVGRWREKDREALVPIDPLGVLPDGRPLHGPADLRRALLERPEQFVQTLTEKLMVYGLGRLLDYRDMPTVRRIVAESAADDYRFSSLILAIVRTPQFQWSRAPDAETVAAVATDPRSGN